ncbi:Acyl-CoA dehydrogenase OS=Streptomyces antimycoticus OX=68175 GN=SANT12839_056440 PE=3 SV=1 [Streptomyces antimycoticus]
MDFAFGPEDERFRTEARDWLAEHFAGPFAALKQEPGGHPGEARGDMTARRAWERELGTGGWIGLGWDRTDGAYGDRAATLTQQVVWAEEYARAGAPGRLGHIGENLLAPTLLVHGDSAQRARFLPPIARGEELWCQGYSEPDAGSDLAGLRTRAVRDPGEGTYRITGQKIWTSSPMKPTGALCWRAPRKAHSAIMDSPFCWCRWTSRDGSRCGRSGS